MGLAAAGLPGGSVGEVRVAAVVDLLHRRDDADAPDARGRQQGPFFLPAPGHVLHPAVQMAVDDVRSS